MGGPRGRVLKEKKMGGHEGCERRLLGGIQVMRINYLHNIVYVRGPVPGGVHDYCYIYDTYIKKKMHKPENPPPFPTYLPQLTTGEATELPDEAFAENVHKFDDPNIEFQEEEQVKRKLKVKAKVKAARR